VKCARIAAVDWCYICSLTEEGFGCGGGRKSVVSVWNKDYLNSVLNVIEIMQLALIVRSTVFLLNSCGRHLANIRVFTDRTDMLCDIHYKGVSEDRSVGSVAVPVCFSSHSLSGVTCQSPQWCSCSFCVAVIALCNWRDMSITRVKCSCSIWKQH
jgi:hypothetical protein